MCRPRMYFTYFVQNFAEERLPISTSQSLAFAEFYFTKPNVLWREIFILNLNGAIYNLLSQDYTKLYFFYRFFW